MARREPDPDDARGTLVVLTDKGRQLFDDVAPAHLANEERLLAALIPEERAALAGLRRKLLMSFESSSDGPTPVANTQGRAAQKSPSEG